MPRRTGCTGVLTEKKASPSLLQRLALRLAAKTSAVRATARAARHSAYDSQALVRETNALQADARWLRREGRKASANTSPPPAAVRLPVYI